MSKISKNPKRVSTIMTTAILVLLVASSLVALSAAYTLNPHPDEGTTWVDPNYLAYLSSENSAAARAAEYGELIQPAYEWHDPFQNNPERNAFGPGPAPDRPDVIWDTTDEPSVSTILVDNAPVSIPGARITSIEGNVMAMDGQLFADVAITLADGTTQSDNLASLDPHTGAINWVADLPSGASIGADFGAHSHIYKVDDSHILTEGGGVCMWTTDGEFLWRDPTITPGAVYHSAVVAPDPEYKIFGPESGSRADEIVGYDIDVPVLCGWDLSDPEVNKTGTPEARLLWYYIMDEPGNPMMCYGDGMIFMGAYSSYTVYAVNATTGEKIWETLKPAATGYAGTYAEGKLFVGCQSQYEIALDGETGKIVWLNDDGVANRAFNVWNVAYAYGRVYYHDLGAGTTGATKCYNASTGEKLWASLTTFYIGYYSTVIGDGKIYGSQSDGSTTTGREPEPLSFACWDAFTGEYIWSITLNAPGPVLAYGCLYLQTGGFMAAGQLYCVSTALGPEPWSMWRGNVENPGYTSSRGPVNLRDGPKWTYTTGGGIISSPVVANGKIYIGSNDKHLYCLDAYDGSFKWKFLLDQPLMTKFGSTPAVVGDKVIIGPDDSNIYCLDANDGTELWSRNVGTYTPHEVSLGQADFRPSPIIYKNRIYIGSPHDNTLYCYDLNGNLVWNFTTGGPLISSVAIENNIVYQLTWGSDDPPWDDQDTCYMLDADTGAHIRNFTVLTAYYTETGGFWATIFGQPPSYTPVVVNDILYIGTTTHNMAAYNTTSGELMWMAEQPNILGENSCGSPVYVPDDEGGRIFSQAGPTVAAIEADLVPNTKDMRPMLGSFFTGFYPNPYYNKTVIVAYNHTDPSGPGKTNIWSAWAGWMVWSSVIYSGFGDHDNALVYSGSESYSMTAWSAEDGTPVSWYTTGGNIPGSAAIWDGKLYFGSADCKVYCFEDHPTHETTISIELDKTKLNMTASESVTVTAKLQGVNSLNPYVEEFPERSLAPPIPPASVFVTFTKPDGVTTVDLEATTDNNGKATFTYTPTEAGTWTAITWYHGEDKPTYSYSYAFSDQIPIEVFEAEEGNGEEEEAEEGIPMAYIYAIVAVIAIIIIAVAAYVFMKRGK